MDREMWRLESAVDIEPPFDYDWVTERLALGGGIWTCRNMEQLAAVGITHVVNMQPEFDDNTICGDTGVKVLWNPCDDDFEPKPAEFFARGVAFAMQAWRKRRARLYFHCAAGVHRGPMMLAAFMAALGSPLDDAITLIRERRPQADFPPVYRDSIAKFLERAPVRDALPE